MIDLRLPGKRGGEPLPLLAALLCVVVPLMPAKADVAVDPAATQVVERFNATMLSVLKDANDLGYTGRLDRLRPVMLETFDFDFMAEKAMGRYWRQLTEADRELWRETFSAFMCANYAGRLHQFTGQTFETLGTQTAPSETVIVQTRVIDPAADNVDLSYRMRSTTSGWRVIDVYLNGTVSELALRRADYSAVMKKDGFEALVASVNQKIADLAKGKAV